MHTQRIAIWQHKHDFNIEKKENENRTSVVVVITLLTMIVEIVVGWTTGSMALYADGWHMGTHAFALGISVLAYALARRLSEDRTFAFGTWKIEILGAYSSALVLGIVGVLMIATSVERVIHPLGIHYDEAIIVAALGLVVNAVCVLILNTRKGGHGHAFHRHIESDHAHIHSNTKHSTGHGDHSHSGDYHHPGHEEHTDLNFRSAYLHVLADACTSLLAIGALIGAKYLHLNWLDPTMGIIGAGLILRWSWLLLKETSGGLLDRHSNMPLASRIGTSIESDGDTRISDLHLWRVEQGRYACIVSVVTSKNYHADDLKKIMKEFPEIVHATVEVNPCQYNLS